jgi:hypothetical protein
MPFGTSQTSSALVVPEPLASLHTLPTRVKNLPNSVDEIQSFIKKTLAARNA